MASWRFVPLILAILSGAVLATEPVIVLTSGAKPGRYFFEIEVAEDGGVISRRITHTMQLAKRPATADIIQPETDPVADDSDDLGLCQIVTESLAAIPDYAGKGQHAKFLAAAYRQLADDTGLTLVKQLIDQPWNQVIAATVNARHRLLGKSAEEWHDLFSAIDRRLSELEANGQLETHEQIQQAYRQIARGLDEHDDLPRHLRELVSSFVRLTEEFAVYRNSN